MSAQSSSLSNYSTNKNTQFVPFEEYMQARAQNLSLSKIIDQLQYSGKISQQTKQIIDQNMQLIKDNDMLSSKLATNENLLRQARDIISNLQEENAILKLSNQRKANSKSEYSVITNLRDVESKKYEHSYRSKEIAGLQNLLETEKQTNSQIHKEIAITQNEKVELQEQIIDLKQEIEKLQRVDKETEEKYEEWERTRAEYEAEIEQKNASLAEVIDTLTEIVQIITRMKNMKSSAMKKTKAI